MKIFSSLLVFGVFGFGSFAQSTSGVVNHYEAVNSIDYFNRAVNVSSTSNFSVGDYVILIQMQGATIDESQSLSFGTITGLGGAGLWEIHQVCGKSGIALSFEHKISDAFDSDGAIQLVSFAAYAGLTLTGNIESDPWNGSTGGVLALKVDGTLDLDSFDIDVSGMGFRGGGALESGAGCTFLSNPDYYESKTSANERAHKGEGISAFILNKETNRGPQANGGGGGNNHNAGGSGGANYGSGGAGGQRVKSTSLTCGSVVGLTTPGLSSYISSDNRIFLGGGGGAGHGNNPGITGESGLNGGGIVIIRADTILGRGRSIMANGIGATLKSENEGGGGGGAGGVIVLSADTIISPVDLQVNGGVGTSVDNFGTSNCSGPGGGGGGGLIGISKSSSTISSNLTSQTNGGNSGTIASSGQSGCDIGDKNGAGNGASGSLIGSFALQYALNDTLVVVDTGCGSYSTPTGMTYDESGLYPETFSNVYGCQLLNIYDLHIVNINNTIISSTGTWSTSEDSADMYFWFDCEADTLFPDTGNQFNSIHTGNVSAIVIKDGCVDTSDCVFVEPSGLITRSQGNAFSVWPNPSNGLFKISSPVTRSFNFSIYNVLGSLIISDKGIDYYELQFESSGIFIVEVGDGIHSEYYKIVVK